MTQWNMDAVMKVAERPDNVMVYGEGSWLTDDQGNRYLDFLQGWAVNCLGHSHPKIVEAISQQAGKLMNPSPAFYNEPMIALSQLLVQHSGFDQVFFANSGAEANEGAIKLARKWGSKYKKGAYEIICFERAFHGRTLATMSASGKPEWAELFAPKLAGFKHVPFNDINAVLAAINKNTVAVMLEPVQGEAGVIAADPVFLKQLREITKKQDLLLIIDEVQTGMGRTGQLFAHQHAAIQADIMTLGKGLGGGFPLSALLVTDQVACFEPGEQGGTYNGNPLATAVGLAVLTELTRPGFMDAVKDKSQQLKLALETLQQQDKYRLIRSVRGLGLLQAIHFHRPIAKSLVERAFKAGLLINAAQADVIRFMPSLLVTEDEIHLMTDILLQQVLNH